MALRALPQMTDFRPADANETAAAWRLALERKSPSFFALSRQDLPVLDPDKLNIYEGVGHGAYIVEKGGESPDLLIVATGAEVWLALHSAEKAQGGRRDCAGRLDAELEDLSRSSRRSIRLRSSTITCRSCRSRRVRRWAGGSMWGGTAT